MKTKQTLKVISICLIVISLLPISIFSQANTFSWYCVRNKEHRQPSLDANMQFIENYNGYFVDKKKADDSADKVIYLTFDAGYENGNVARILDVLAEEKVPGAFFVLKNLLIKAPELIRRMVREGHLVCNHTSNHKDITRYESSAELVSDLEELEVLFKDITKKDMPKYFRPPEGKFSEQSLKFICDSGYKTIFWSFAYADWDNSAQMSKESAMKKIMDNLHNGEVMLLHPTSQTNAEIMQELIRELKAQGYRFGTLDELTV